MSVILRSAAAAAATALVFSQAADAQSRKHVEEAHGASGRPPAMASAMIDTDPFGYTGAYTDPGGRIYLRSRYLHVNRRTSGASFLTPDSPTAGMLNHYAYAAGDPVNLVDPTGEAPVGDWLNGAHTFFTGLDLPHWLPYVDTTLGLVTVLSALPTPVPVAGAGVRFALASIVALATIPSTMDQISHDTIGRGVLSPTLRSYADLASIAGGVTEAATALSIATARGSARVQRARLASEHQQLARDATGSFELSKLGAVDDDEALPSVQAALLRSIETHGWRPGHHMLQKGVDIVPLERRLRVYAPQHLMMDKLTSPDNLGIVSTWLRMPDESVEIPPSVLYVQWNGNPKFFPYNGKTNEFEGADALFTDKEATYESWRVLMLS